MFVSRNGTPLWTNKINEHLKEFCKKAGIRYLSSHSIRVSNITSLYDSGVAPTKIQVAAGHSDIRTTNGYCRSEICDEISTDILEKALKATKYKGLYPFIPRTKKPATTGKKRSR